MTTVGVARVADAVPSLALLVAGMTGRCPEVQVCQSGAADAVPLRPVLTSTHLLLPGDDGVDSYGVWRAAAAHAAAHLRFSAPHRPVTTLKPLSIAVVSAIEDARVERLLVRDFPGVRRWFLEHLAPRPAVGDLSFAALLARMDRVLADPLCSDDNYWVNKARALFEAAAQEDLHDYHAFRAIASTLANDLGQMRVRFEPQHYTVPARYRDDNSYLWDHGDVQTPPEKALTLRAQTVAARARQQEAVESHDGLPAGEPELETGRFSYPEWDRRTERLRTDWCTVIEKRPAWQGMATLPPNAKGSLKPASLALRRVRRLSRTRRLRRQWEGDDLDLNAAIEVLVDCRLRLRPEPRLFMRPGSDPLASSILVLLDLSESTNDRRGVSGHSLLELEKQAALSLAASVTPGGDRVAIHGFSSNTRAEVYYYRLLDFGEPLSMAQSAMIRSVEARFSTRMGAALRHAAALLQQEASAQRAILVVTDGAPSDVDVSEPRYLVEDARMAVLDARRAGVRTFCVAVDAAADQYVKRIFGWRDYAIADDSRSLPAQLQRAFARLTAM